MERQILAISGSGFSTQENSTADQYLLHLVKHGEKKKICFIPTASNDAQGYIDKFNDAFQAEQPSHIKIENMSNKDIEAFLCTQDIIYVGGGNPQLMLREWKKHDFDKALRTAYQNGVILAGMSAGAMCWFETCFSENSEYTYEEFKGLGLLKGSFCPHYNDQIVKTQFDQWERTKRNVTTYKLNDNEAIYFKNEKAIRSLN